MKIGIDARGARFEFDCPADEAILLAGLRAGIALPHECGTGTCGTCKAVVVDGAVDEGWEAAPGRKFLKAGTGEILMCQATPRSACELQVRGRTGPLETGVPVPAHRAGRIAAMSWLNADVVQLEIEPGQPMPFLAGQFMLVQCPGVPGPRGWSMTNAPGDGRRLVFTVKMMPGGGVSDWLRAHDRAGTAVTLFGPLGKAYLRADDKDLVMIAGGSGLAPMLSILAEGARNGHFAQHRAHLFFGVRKAADLYGVDDLVAIRAAHPGTVAITVALSDEEPGPAVQQRYPGVAFANGFVHAVAGAALKGPVAEATAFLAGPPPMVDAAMRMLIMEAKLPPNRMRYDKFA